MTKKKRPAKKDKIDLFIEEFQNRKRYPTLTVEILKKIPDAKLEQAIMDFIECKVEQKGVSEREVIKTLSSGFMAIYTTWWVEAEVFNGGSTNISLIPQAISHATPSPGSILSALQPWLA